MVDDQPQLVLGVGDVEVLFDAQDSVCVLAYQQPAVRGFAVDVD